MQQDAAAGLKTDHNEGNKMRKQLAHCNAPYKCTSTV